MQLSPLGDWNREVSPDDLRRLTASLRSGGPELQSRTTTQIAEGLAATAAEWLRDDSPWMQRAETEGSVTSGFSSQMMRWALTDLLRRITPRSLAALVQTELGSLEPFQAPRSRGSQPCARGANPPRLVFQVLAGTVPPVGIETIALALLARAPLLLKTASADPTVPRLFLESLRETAPALANHVAVCTWRGGTPILDDAACTAADIVVAYGADDTVNALMHRCRFPTRFYGYGHRVSFAIVGPSSENTKAALEDVARDLALDAAAYDQRGCMSPHCVFVSADAPWSTTDLAKAVSDAFATLESEIPRGRLEPAVAAEFMQQSAVAEFSGNAWLAPTSLVVAHEDTRFVPSSGGRALHLVPYSDDEALLTALAPLAGAISTVGVRHEGDTQPLIHALGQLGARRICRLGRMQRPLWLRDHDGRPRLGDWVDWTNVEPLY